MNSISDNANLREGASGEGQQSDQPIRFAGSVLGAKRHICAFFHNRDEEYQVLLPFIKEGLKRGEKAFHIVDPQLREEHLGSRRRGRKNASNSILFEIWRGARGSLRTPTRLWVSPSVNV